ncbi:MAG: DNA polymerase III subunit gamma/tau, partial [Pelagibacterales bacterium]|nr:DNA polymerase III subunit gamma/tau [Pelagibacterales bacterium]
DVVAETISNSIKAKKVPNAYLFTGIRGVGKTTIARIVAKALNCEKGIENLCKEKMCEHCEAITNSNHIDVLEMDAASKTGVDDVRDLIEFSRYGPTSAKYKIFIVDEVHQMSKAAFNALLKTLEEPPQYLKFIFATTEIKKLPVTVVSRCQRFDLPRIKSNELFEFIKKVSEKENGKVTDDALKLIVKISEGSVRDALSLLDRALVSLEKNSELDLATAQKIFGCFDKSNLIELFEHIFLGEETKVIDIYRSIYNQGVEPKVFLNDFLELLYYLKNISYLKIDGTNFNLNDAEFNSIKKLASSINNEILLLFWQFTIKTLEEVEVVSNQHIAMEMFLIRLMYLKGISNFKLAELNHKESNKDNIDKVLDNRTVDNKKNDDDLFNIKNKTIGQIKNIVQEKKQTEKSIFKSSNQTKLLIKNFEDLINLCSSKKEIKLKHELETNVNLVSFENKRIEISFNEKLDKEFIKNLSTKLYEWTNDRWIISLSKENGEPSKKEKEILLKNELLEKAKKSEVYKKVLEAFPDAELINIEKNVEQNND